MQISSPGIVIRDFKYEKNRILTLLTKKNGVITAFANGANIPRNALAGSTELLCYSDFVLFHNRGKYTVNHADSIRLFFGIRSRIDDLSLASYLSQLFGELSPVEEPADAYVQLLLNCFHFLEEETRPQLQIKSIAELRLLTFAGYMPNLVGCSVCDVYTSDKMYLSLNGNLVCGGCKETLGEEKLLFLPPGVLQGMRHIIYSETEKVFQFSLSTAGLATLSNIIETYLLYQLEKTFPALEFYHSLMIQDSTKE